MRRDAGRDWCGAGGLTFVRTADAAVLRAQKTRSKNRRCFTVLHHHTSLSRLTSPSHNSERQNEDRTFPATRSPAQTVSFFISESAITSEHQHSTIFTSKVPLIFPFMRNCERNFCIGKKQKYSGTSYG